MSADRHMLPEYGASAGALAAAMESEPHSGSGGVVQSGEWGRWLKRSG